MVCIDKSKKISSSATARLLAGMIITRPLGGFIDSIDSARGRRIVVTRLEPSDCVRYIFDKSIFYDP